MSKMNEERVNPIRITVDGNVYELDFSRESVAFAEQRGFKAEDVIAFRTQKFRSCFSMHCARITNSLPGHKATSFWIPSAE